MGTIHVLKLRQTGSLKQLQAPIQPETARACHIKAAYNAVVEKIVSYGDKRALVSKQEPHYATFREL